MKYHKQASFLMVCLILALSVPALATGSRLAGVWRSTTGATISIPNTPNDFDLVYKHPNGRTSLYKAHWVAGMAGLQFWFLNEKGGRNNCSYNPRKDQVRIIYGQSENWWVRIR